MTLPASGIIKASQIQTEFGGSNPISISEYYGLDSGIPSTGPIKFSDFYGKVINATRTINATNNFNARTDFENNATIVGGKRTSAAVYASNTAVKYYITVNGTIGATGTGSYAFDVGTFSAGTTIYLTNNSYIVGAGGAGGNSGASGTFFTGGGGGGGYCSSSGNQTACSASGAAGADLGSAAAAGSGSSGSGGTAGGAAGNYITNSVYATWVTTGTRLGGAA